MHAQVLRERVLGSSGKSVVEVRWWRAKQAGMDAVCVHEQTLSEVVCGLASQAWVGFVAHGQGLWRNVDAQVCVCVCVCVCLVVAKLLMRARSFVITETD